MEPIVTLNSGYVMPVIGMGTFSCDSIAEDELVEIFVKGIKLGYRHIDTAACYGTEKAVGKAVSKAVEQKIVSSREEFFITSKLWGTDAHGDLVVAALKKSLENLGLEYLDLYLIHWPVRLRKKAKHFPIEKEDILPFDLRSTWAGMEECKRLGLVRSIGVSNFSSKKLSDLVDFATILPAVNQVEMNPFWQQKTLRDFCEEKGIVVTAYSPLGAPGSVYQGVDVMNHPTLSLIALANNKSAPQICLRWLYEQGVTIAVKSYNEGRMKQNLQIFDWELSEADKNMIANIPQKKGFCGDMLVFPNGVYQSVQQLELIKLPTKGSTANETIDFEANEMETHKEFPPESNWAESVFKSSSTRGRGSRGRGTRGRGRGGRPRGSTSSTKSEFKEERIKSSLRTKRRQPKCKTRGRGRSRGRRTVRPRQIPPRTNKLDGGLIGKNSHQDGFINLSNDQRSVGRGPLESSEEREEWNDMETPQAYAEKEDNTAGYSGSDDNNGLASGDEYDDQTPVDYSLRVYGSAKHRALLDDESEEDIDREMADNVNDDGDRDYNNEDMEDDLEDDDA